MNKYINWLVGDRAGRVMVAIWNWLWGIPIDSNPQIAKEVAQVSLNAMNGSVNKLMESVATVVAVHQQAKAIYDGKQKEFEHAERQALLAHKKGDRDSAHLAMSRAIQLENLLPQLQERVAHAEQLAEQMKQKLRQERQKLEHYKVEMQNLSALAEVNQALAAIAKTSGDLELGTAKTQFDQANRAVQHQHFKSSARAELSQNPADALQSTLDQLTLEDQVIKRLQQLETP
jgi:phage shock protein A